MTDFQLEFACIKKYFVECICAQFTWNPFPHWRIVYVSEMLDPGSYFWYPVIRNFFLYCLSTLFIFYLLKVIRIARCCSYSYIRIALLPIARISLVVCIRKTDILFQNLDIYDEFKKPDKNCTPSADSA